VLARWRHIWIFTSGESSTASTPVQRYVIEYRRYLVQQRGLSESCLPNYTSFVEQFLSEGFGENEPCFVELCAADVTTLRQPDKQGNNRCGFIVGVGLTVQSAILCQGRIRGRNKGKETTFHTAPHRYRALPRTLHQPERHGRAGAVRRPQHSRKLTNLPRRNVHERPPTGQKVGFASIGPGTADRSVHSPKAGFTLSGGIASGCQCETLVYKPGVIGEEVARLSLLPCGQAAQADTMAARPSMRPSKSWDACAHLVLMLPATSDRDQFAFSRLYRIPVGVEELHLAQSELADRRFDLGAISHHNPDEIVWTERRFRCIGHRRHIQ
jgi:hypothetical protein